MGEIPNLDLYPPDIRRRLLALPPEERQKLLEQNRQLLKDKTFRQLMLRSSEVVLAEDLYKKILLGSANALFKRSAKSLRSLRNDDFIDPFRMAWFLSSLAHCRNPRVPWAVRVGLKWLGIKRPTTKRGRPAGRKVDSKYFTYVTEAERLIEREGVWEMKRKMIRKYPQHWSNRLERWLDDHEWGPETRDFIQQSKTQRSLAIWMTARHFDASYDAVARACRRFSKAAKN